MAGLPFDDRDGFIWLDGEFTDWCDAKVHFLTHSLHYSSAVFEGIRIYEGKIFKLNEHNRRLLDSCEIMDINHNYSLDYINNACIETIKRNNIENGYIRPLIWRGSEDMALGSKGISTHLGVAAWAWPSLFGDEMKNKGIKVMTSEWRRPAPDSSPYKAKASGLYMICTMAKNKADRNGFNDALMLDYRGYVAEVTSCNFFMVKDGVLHTPLPDCFLNGITRQTVIELAKHSGIQVRERHITPEEVKDADECFVTGTAVEVMPVSQIDNITYDIGNITNSLIVAYDKLVRS